MLIWLKELFIKPLDKSMDPVQSCELYLDKKAGSCAHVDGPLCDFPTCFMLENYKLKRQVVKPPNSLN